MSPILVIWTAENLEEARRICRHLIERKLIASANTLPNIQSIYRWRGQIDLRPRKRKREI